MAVRRTVTTLLFAISLATLLVVSPGAAAAGKDCIRKNARVLKTSMYARVVSIGPRSYGCLISRDKMMPLHEDPDGFVEPPRLGPAISLNGRWLGYELRTFGRDDPSFEVLSVDLRSGVFDRNRPATPTYLGEPQPGTGGVTALKVTSSGQLAWIIHNPFSPTLRYEVRASDRYRGSIRLLDAGPDVQPRYLRLDGRRLTWRNGTARQALLRARRD